MKAKEYVKKTYPKARSERQKANNGEVYRLIRPELYLMYISTGKTESQAWVNAKKHLISKFNAYKSGLSLIK